MKINELIKDLQEIERLHGNIDVATISDNGLCGIGTRNYNGDFSVVKWYQTKDGYWNYEDFEVEDEDLLDIGSTDSIQINLLL